MSETPKPNYKLRPVGPRKAKDKTFLLICVGSAGFSILLLGILLFSIGASGGGRLSWDFLTSYNSSNNATEAGILPALIGSIWLLFICAVTAIPLGVGTAILLEEYQPKQKFLKFLHGFVQTNITNLAGVPSIVYGILGVSAFAAMDLFGSPGSMNEPAFTIGQSWYNEYYDLADNAYYTRSSGRDAELPAAAVGMVFYETTGLSKKANVRILPEEELRPVKQRIAGDLRGIESAVRDGIDDARTSRRGPVEIGPKAAMAIAQKAFVQTNLKADTEELLGITIAQLQAMDGMEGSDLRTARRELMTQLEKAELKAAGVSGLIIEGSTPQRRDRRAWYYAQIPFGRSVLAGGLTLMLVILPIIIVASSEAIRAVPSSMRAGCLALGGTKWQSIAKVVLPASIPGICTGSILAMSRAIGEAAPIILMGAVLITYLPENLMSQFSAMPLQIFQWTAEPDKEFQRTAAAGIIVLLVVLLSFNAVAVAIRAKMTKNY